MSPEEFTHEELFPTPFEFADKFGIRMVVEMRTKVVHARKKFPTKFAYVNVIKKNSVQDNIDLLSYSHMAYF